MASQTSGRAEHQGLSRPVFPPPDDRSHRLAVVTEEGHDGVLGQTIRIEGVENRPDRLVHRNQHGRIHPQRLGLDVGDPRLVGLLGLQGRVDRIEGEVDEESGLLVFLDKLHRLPSQPVGQVFVAVPQRAPILGLAGIDMPRPGPVVTLLIHPDVFPRPRTFADGPEIGFPVDPRIHPVQSPFRRNDDVPLAHRRRPVAGRAESFGQDGMGLGYTVMPPVEIALHPETLLVGSGEQAGPAGRADRSRGIAAGEADAFRRQALDMRSWHQVAAIATGIAVAQVVHKNQYDIRAILRLSDSHEARKAREAEDHQAPFFSPQIHKIGSVKH